MNYRGSCHCGAVAFDVEGDIESALACNCSICQRRGSLLWFVPREKLSLLTPEGGLATYTFNTHRIQHHHCPTCGCAPFADGAMPDGTPMAAVNLRCIEGLDLASIPVKHYDGAAV